MGTISDKLTYLNTTKTMLRDSLNKFGSNILSTDTFRSYDTKLNEIYDKLPKITQSGAGLTITPVQNGQVDDFKMNGVDLYQNQLPSEYTAVEYLQSDNECFIDTGINADYKLSLKIKTACLNSTQQHMGAINNTGSSYIRHHITFNPSQPQDIGIYIGQTNNQLSLKSFDNNYHEFNLDIYNKKVSIDNDSPISISYNNFDVGINYYLFARNGSSIAISKGSYKIAYCKMYYEDNLVRDFAPCYRNSDNVAGLYDFVTNTFFTNQGTGTFTVGNNITLPNPDYPQEIKVVEGRQVVTDSGKNLFDKNNANILTGFLADGGTFNSTTGYKTLYISCNNSSTYTIQKTSGSFFRVAEFENIPANGDNWITRTKDDNANVITFTTTTGNYLAVTYFKSSDTVTEQEMLNSIQIEEGSTATDFEPYYNPVSYNIDLNLENIYLAKMPNTDYKNRIYKNNGNWYFEENVEKFILDGSRNWRRYTSGNYTVFYIENNGATTGSSNSNPVLSDKFKSKFEIGNDNIFLSSAGNRISISTTIADSIEDWITWLSTHNVIVYYALATPVTTQITNTTLINQLEAISVHTGTNIITISNDNNIIPEIEITRLKELEKLA